jgi:ATP-dependent DNA helicase DinG
MLRSLPSIDALFSPDGSLASVRGFEHRPQQAEMASAVFSSLRNREHLIVEAPTGVGKTLAYLLPAMVFALGEGKKALISTHTKNLQDQLVKKDLPLAAELLGVNTAVALLKGRQNYLCTSRLQSAVEGRYGLFDKQGQEQIRRISEWSQHTATGDLEELPFLPRQDILDKVCSERGICSSQQCGSRCFFQKAKVRAREANVVVLNHALFFSLLALHDSEEHFLFPGDFVIFDEAHTIEATVSAGLGLKVSHRQLVRAMHKLVNRKTRRGLLVRHRKAAGPLSMKAEESADQFFKTLEIAARMLVEDASRDVAARRAIRIRRPNFIIDSVSDPLKALADLARKEEDDCDDLFAKQELVAARNSLQTLTSAIITFVEQRERDLTYWVELSDEEKGNAALCAAPSDVAGVLGPRLFLEDTSVIMTSASLSVQGSLQYFSERLGAFNAKTLIVDSPFDFTRCMTVAIARDIPEPENEDYLEELPGWIMRSIERTHGKCLVLFTNAQVMNRVAETIEDMCAEHEIRVLVQGRDGQRHALLQDFKKDIDSVLFGLESFWMGVDVPGESLSQVIITRLPFAVPNHPLIEARLEAIAERGGNAFVEYTLPEAILRFKQGAGRLIRSRDDSGIITILDSRIIRKSYGRSFIRSLPLCPLEIMSSTGEVERVDAFEL